MPKPTPRKPVGRPPQPATPEHKAEFVRRVANGSGRFQAARDMNFCGRRLRRILAEDADFRADVIHAEQSKVDFCETLLYARIISGDPESQETLDYAERYVAIRRRVDAQQIGIANAQHARRMDKLNLELARMKMEMERGMTQPRVAEVLAAAIDELGIDRSRRDEVLKNAMAKLGLA